MGGGVGALGDRVGNGEMEIGGVCSGGWASGGQRVRVVATEGPDLSPGSE